MDVFYCHVSKFFADVLNAMGSDGRMDPEQVMEAMVSAGGKFGVRLPTLPTLPACGEDDVAHQRAIDSCVVAFLEMVDAIADNIAVGPTVTSRHGSRHTIFTDDPPLEGSKVVMFISPNEKMTLCVKGVGICT